MKTVFRVERDGIGPYISCNNVDLENHDLSENHCERRQVYFRPGRITDQLPWHKPFGFQSKKKLKRWFPLSLRQKLKDEGFVVSVYRVHMVYHGKSGKQCVFEPMGEPRTIDLLKV